MGRKVPSNQHLVEVAAAAARRGAAIIRSMPRPGPKDWSTKGGPSDFVTEVDRAAERAVRDVILDAFPDSEILGEELSSETDSRSDVHTSGRSGDNLLWVVDPIDGTTNYLHDYPAYAVSVAAVVDGELAAGAVLDVPRDALYTATAGGGAWCGETRLAVSAVTEPPNALIGTGFPFKWPDLLPPYVAQFSAIIQATAGIRRAGAAALDLVDVALGRFDGFWELMLAPWDVAAGSLIVREAGGRVTDLDGSPTIVRHGAFVAGNPAIHDWLLELLARHSVDLTPHLP
jgi:myo-inositol-1(or 4)-monophosphatase